MMAEYNDLPEEQKEYLRAKARASYYRRRYGIITEEEKFQMPKKVRLPYGLKKTKAEKKESDQKKKKRYILENAEAKALGLTYGKYRVLKDAGKLPESIDLGEYKPKGKQLKNRSVIEANFRKANEEAMKMAEVKALEASYETKAIVEKGDEVSKRYRRIYERQKAAEAIRGENVTNTH